jgi:hypothetical protein
MKRLLSILLIVFAHPLWGAEATVAVAPPNLAEVDALEEILIEGNRDSLSSARKAMEKAEDRLYDRFNELNPDDAFDIECGFEAPTGTRLKVRVCEVKGLQIWSQAEVGSLLFNTGSNVTMVLTASMRDVFMAEAKKRMLALIRKDPELMRALLERARLEKHYEELRKEKFSNRWIVWD